MTLVFLVGEGPNDIGDLFNEPAYRDGAEGFFQPLIRSILGPECSFDGQKITLLGKTTVKSRTGAAKKKPAIAAALAEYAGADVLVFAWDADHHFEDRRRDTLAALDQSPVPFAVALVKECLEAWPLGDREAVRSLVAEAQVPTKPEELWGQHDDPAGNHPKHVLRRIFGGAVATETYAALGAAVSPARLAKSCPTSFVPFQRELVAALDR